MDFKDIRCYECYCKPCKHGCDFANEREEEYHSDHCDSPTRDNFLVLPVNHYNTQIFFFCGIDCAKKNVAAEVISDLITVATYENQLLNDYIVGDKE